MAIINAAHRPQSRAKAKAKAKAKAAVLVPLTARALQSHAASEELFDNILDEAEDECDDAVEPKRKKGKKRIGACGGCGVLLAPENTSKEKRGCHDCYDIYVICFQTCGAFDEFLDSLADDQITNARFQTAKAVKKNPIKRDFHQVVVNSDQQYGLKIIDTMVGFNRKQFVAKFGAEP